MQSYPPAGGGLPPGPQMGPPGGGQTNPLLQALMMSLGQGGAGGAGPGGQDAMLQQLLMMQQMGQGGQQMPMPQPGMPSQR